MSKPRRWLLVAQLSMLLAIGFTAVVWAAVQLDPSFDGDGKVTTDFFGGSNDLGNALAIQSDGKLVVAGTVWTSEFADDFAVARYHPDGSLDTSFDSDGKVTTDFSGRRDFGFGRDSGSALAIQSDGKIVVAGTAETFSAETFVGFDDDLAVVRYHPDGSLDTSFDSDGKVTTDFFGRSDHGLAIAIQSDGKILVAGYAETGKTRDSDIVVARYHPDGSLDTSFDSDGKVTTDLSGSYDGASALAIQSDGKIVVAGSATAAGASDIAVVRYHPDGSLDTSFDSDGKVTTSFTTDDLFGFGFDSGGDLVPHHA